MQLSRRLSALAEMVTEGNRLVDVGCDHGYLPVYLTAEKRIPSAIAMDVREGPLSRAQEHIQAYGLSGYIETRLSDGLQKLNFGEGDTLVIAGMGGPLMERILAEGADLLPGFQELILQPQSDIPHFRRFIRKNGWEITEEKLVCEDGKYYPMMKVQKRSGKMPEWTEEEYLFGKHLLQEKHPVLLQFLQRELRIREEILSLLSDAKDARVLARRTEVTKEKEMILHVLKEWGIK